MRKWTITLYLLSLMMMLLVAGCGDSDDPVVIKPSSVGSLTVTPADAQLTVTWAAVTGATSYKVFYNTTNNSFTATEFTGDSNPADTTCIITGLTNGTPYYVWVKAVNSAGSSDFSAASSPATPTASVTVPPVPISLGVTAGDAQLTVTWAAVTGATSYKVFYNTTNNSSTATEFTGDSNTADTTCIITGLTNGTTYYVWVKAVNSLGSSDFAPGSSSGYSTLTVSSGILDPAFDTDGIVTTAFGAGSDAANSVAIQIDGKIVVAGYSSASGSNEFALERLNADGSLDTTFGTNGKVTTNFGGTSAEAYSVIVQPDGKIIAAGWYQGALNRYFFALARYNSNGTLDTTFDTDGKVTTAIGTDDAFINSVAIQADGKIVAAGYAYNSGTSNNFALARYNANGTIDTTFGTGGQVITVFGTGLDIASSVAIQADGKIVAAGLSVTTSNDFALARYNSDGTLDTTFDTDGKITTDFGSSQEQIYGVAIQADGKIVAAGYSNSDFALARYNSNGTLDTTFDTDGKVTTAIGAGEDVANAIAIQSDGKIVAAGYAISGSKSDFALARYKSDGTLDTTFGTGGKVITVIGTAYDAAKCIAIQSDGKIVAAGVAENGGRHFAVARYK